jgi:hypothetical protein
LLSASPVEDGQRSVRWLRIYGDTDAFDVFDGSCSSVGRGGTERQLDIEKLVFESNSPQIEIYDDRETVSITDVEGLIARP